MTRLKMHRHLKLMLISGIKYISTWASVMFLAAEYASTWESIFSGGNWCETLPDSSKVLDVWELKVLTKVRSLDWSSVLPRKNEKKRKKKKKERRKKRKSKISHRKLYRSDLLQRTLSIFTQLTEISRDRRKTNLSTYLARSLHPLAWPEMRGR